MDIPVGASLGALRVGIQIVSTAKRPLIDVYQRTHNILGPEQDLGYPETPGGVQGHRFSENYISFTAVNIGTRRAENVTVRIGPGLSRDNHPFGELFETTIPSLAPGQALQLCRLQDTDLLEYVYEEHPSGLRTGHPAGFKTARLVLLIEYDGPWQGLGRIGRAWATCRRRKQYNLRYEFEPRSVATDYPPVEVLG